MKRLAKKGRDLYYRTLTALDHVVRWNSREVLPPAHLRNYYYGSLSPAVFARACEGARTELVSRGLQPHQRVLDIGAGIGNLAIGLIGYLHGGYDGLDIHPEAVAWCQQTITKRHPEFRFHRADLHSEAYNPRGRATASVYTFPFPDRHFDFVFVGSVFTHLLPEAAERYVAEVARVLAPDGRCVASYLLVNDERRGAIVAGRSFMSFHVEHPSGLCRLHDAAVPEAAVALEETFVRNLHERHHLAIEDVRRGGWWCGERHDHDVLTVVAAPGSRI